MASFLRSSAPDLKAARAQEHSYIGWKLAEEIGDELPVAYLPILESIKDMSTEMSGRDGIALSRSPKGRAHCIPLIIVCRAHPARQRQRRLASPPAA
jgi:hypothetical protein